MYFINPGPIARAFYSKKVIWEIPVSSKTLFLTFDDGPEPEVTVPVLNILDDFNIKATFFCVGENIFHHLPLYREILEKGHQTGNHTYNHLNGWKTSTPTYLENIERCRQLVKSDLFRPPYGKMKHTQLHALIPQYSIINWSVLSYDFNPKVSEQQCLKNCVDNLKEGNIFVFHDSLKAKKKLVMVLPAFIETALKQGFKFGLIGDSLPAKC